jgi:MYXO-CTERM domain-containing protein
MEATGVHDYTGRIAANVAGLHAEADLAWSYQAPAMEFDDVIADALKPRPPGPNCEGPGFAEPACDCRSAPQAPSLALLALLSLGTARRRRRLS